MADRTVKVHLALDVSKYRRGALEAKQATAAVKREAHSLADETGKARVQFDDAGKSAKGLAVNTRGASVEAAGLGRNVKGVGDKMRVVGVEASQARDHTRALGAEAGRARAELDRAASAAGRLRGGRAPARGSLMPGFDPAAAGAQIGQTMGGAAVEGFAASFKALPPQAQAALAVGAVAMAVTIAAPIGAAVGGAVAAGVAGGAVVAGVALAAQDPKVKQAGQSLGRELMAGLRADSQVFIGPVLDAIDIVRGAFAAARGDLRTMFATASEFVRPLTRAVAGMLANILPGINSALNAARPVIDMLQRALPALGNSISDMFAQMTRNPAAITSGLETLISTLGGVAYATGQVVGWLSDAYEWLVRVGDATAKATDNALRYVPAVALWRAVAPDFRSMASSMDEAAESTGGAAEATGVFKTSIEGSGAAARTTADDLRNLSHATSLVATEARNAFDAETQLRAAILGAEEAAQKHKGGLDGNTTSTIAARQALHALAEKSVEASEVLKKQGQSQDVVNAKLGQGYMAFVKAAIGMGVSEKAAGELAAELGLIPPTKATRVSVPGADAALEKIASLDSALRHLTGRDLRIRLNYSSNSSGAMGALGQLGMNRWGGAYVHARDGALRDAHIATPSAPARYAYAEPATGGEAFIPKRGNRRRSMSILSTAAGWLGAQVTPAAATGGGGTTVQMSFQAGIVGSQHQLESWLAGALDSLRRQGRHT